MAQKRIELAEHLTVEELKQRYLTARTPREARQWQVLWLLGQGRSTLEAAETVGVTDRGARAMAKRYNERGTSERIDARHTASGRRPKMTPAQEGKLLEALRGKAPDGGLWTGPKVTAWVERETGFRGGSTFGWKTLKRFGARLLVPRRRHKKAADEQDQEAWSQALALKLERERQIGVMVGRQTEVWAQDEARLGLKPILRRVWIVGPERPLSQTWHRYEWLYVVAFVHPSSGRTFWLILPRIDAELFSLALEEFAREVGAGPKKKILLVLDSAGWHTAGELRIPEGIELVPLPAYTPEMQPAERLWPLLREAAANDPVSSLDALEDLLSARIRSLLDQRSQIKAITDYHWWPQAA